MMTLPHAVQFVVLVIAANAGRPRAEVLLAIIGAGPASVRQHLDAVDAALGSQSPGIAALCDMVDQAEQPVSASSQIVRRQHVISQVVTRKFVEDVPPHGKVLARVSLADQKVKLTGTYGVGYGDDFVR